jgi:tryptophan synthase alpha chain
VNRIKECFDALKAKRKKAFVGYVLSGFPDHVGSLELAQGLLDNGADLLEIGVPFSDPIADGVVIQRCAELALKNGGGMHSALELAKALRARSAKPLLLMTYLNPILSCGEESFARAAAEAGIDGVIIPDLTPEESAVLRGALKARGLEIIFLAAPTSTPERLKKIAAAASGFVYMVSVAGVTGERSVFDSRLGGAIAKLRRLSKLPLAVGFGVSSPESAKEAASLGDGVVVASTILKVFLDGQGMGEALEKAKSLIEAAHAA